MLVDVLSDLYSGGGSGNNGGAPQNGTTSSGATNNIKKLDFSKSVIQIILIILLFHRFVCKNNGVLFENDIIQIGIKSEFRQNLGRIGVFYGNKTSMPLQGFYPQVTTIEDQMGKVTLQVKPVDGQISAGAQVQQLVNVECIDDFDGIFYCHSGTCIQAVNLLF